MKNIIALLAWVFIFISCDQSYDYVRPDIEEVDIYQITENGSVINIYINKPLVINSNGTNYTKEVILERSGSLEESPYRLELTTEEKKSEVIMRDVEITENAKEKTIIDVSSTYTYAYVITFNPEEGTVYAEITTSSIKRVGTQLDYEEEENPDIVNVLTGTLTTTKELN